MFHSVIFTSAIIVLAHGQSSNPTTYDALPGVYLMNKGYNSISGIPLYDQSGVDLMDYQWNGRATEPVGDDDTVYEVPIEFQSIPAISPSCVSNAQVNTVYRSTSTSVLTEQSTSFGGGYSSTVDIGISVPLEGATATASTSITNSLMFGHSSKSVNARSYAQNDYSWSFSMDSLSTWYQATIDWNDDSIDIQWKSAFTSKLSELDGNPTYRAILSFINSYGSHVLSGMTAGAVCKQTSYIKSTDTKREALDFRSDVTSDSASYLFWSASQASKNSENKASTSEESVQYEFDNSECHGEISTLLCGGVTGTDNQPYATSYTIEPIWNINDVKMLLSNATLTNIDTFFDNLYQTLEACSQHICNSHGTCTLSDDIWTSEFIDNWDQDFTKLWNTTTNTENYCFCYPGYTGSKCNVVEQDYYWSLFTSVTSGYKEQDGQNGDRTSDNFPNWSGLYAAQLKFVHDSEEDITYSIKEAKSGNDDTWFTEIKNNTVDTARGNDGEEYEAYVADVSGYPDSEKYETSTFTVQVYQKIYTSAPTTAPTVNITTKSPAFTAITQPPTDGIGAFKYLALLQMMSALVVMIIFN